MVEQRQRYVEAVERSLEFVEASGVGLAGLEVWAAMAREAAAVLDGSEELTARDRQAWLDRLSAAMGRCNVVKARDAWEVILDRLHAGSVGGDSAGS